MNAEKDILEIVKQNSLVFKNEKDILEFFKKCEMDEFERRDHFNLKPIINDGLQKIKIFLIDNYNSTDIEELFVDINNIILEIFESDRKELNKEIIFKILNFEGKFVDLISCCKT